MNKHSFKQTLPCISWGRCVPGQTADAPGRTDAQHTRCFTQTASSGRGTTLQRSLLPSRAAQPGLRGRASLSDRPGAQPPPGHHSCDELPSWILSWVPCPEASRVPKGESSLASLTLRAPGAARYRLTLPSNRRQFLQNQQQEQGLPLSSPAPGTARTAQMPSCPSSQHLVQPPEALQHPPPLTPSAQGHTSPGVQKPGPPRGA